MAVALFRQTPLRHPPQAQAARRTRCRNLGSGQHAAAGSGAARRVVRPVSPGLCAKRGPLRRTVRQFLRCPVLRCRTARIRVRVQAPAPHHRLEAVLRARPHADRQVRGFQLPRGAPVRAVFRQLGRVPAVRAAAWPESLRERLDRSRGEGLPGRALHLHPARGVGAQSAAARRAAAAVTPVRGRRRHPGRRWARHRITAPIRHPISPARIPSSVPRCPRCGRQNPPPAKRAG